MNCGNCKYFHPKGFSENNNVNYGHCEEILIGLKLMFNTFLSYKKDNLTVFETFGCKKFKAKH